MPQIHTEVIVLNTTQAPENMIRVPDSQHKTRSRDQVLYMEMIQSVILVTQHSQANQKVPRPGGWLLMTTDVHRAAIKTNASHLLSEFVISLIRQIF